MVFLAAVLSAALFALSSQAAASPVAPAPVLKLPLSAPADEASSRTEELKNSVKTAQSLLQAAAQLNGFDIWQRSRAQLPGQALDADYANDVRRFSFYFRDFSQKCQLLEKKLKTLSEQALPQNAALLSWAEQLARHATDLREQANWLETQARDGMPDLREAGYSAQAVEFQQTALATAAFTRRLDAHAVEILRKIR